MGKNQEQEPGAETAELPAVSAGELEKRLESLETALAAAKTDPGEVASLKEQIAALKNLILDPAGRSALTGENILASERASIEQVRADDKVTIVIASGEGEAGAQPVFVSLNGMTYYIPRDTESEVPRCVYLHLRSVTITDWTLRDNRPKNGREVPRYNIQVVG